MDFRREPHRLGRGVFRGLKIFLATPLLIVVLAGLGAAHILVRTAPYGAAVGTDATIFLSTAMKFLAGEGWRDFTGAPLVTWPPLFPLLLVAGGWVGIEPFAAGRWINATAFGLTILAAGCYLRSNLRARWLVLTATAASAASLPLSEFASRFLTDSLFVLLTLLALIQLASFLHRGGRTPLLWGAVFTALAAVTRYAGVVLIGVGVLLLLVRRTPPLAVRLKDAVAFGAVSSLPLVGVMTRNWAVSRTWTGRAAKSGQSLSDGLNQVADVFREWAMHQDALDGLAYLLWRMTGLGTPDWFGALLWATIGLVVGVLAVVGVLSGRGFGKARPTSPSLGLGPTLPFGVFAVAYLGFMVAVVPFTVHQPIDSRYLLPVYVPLLLTAVWLLDRFLSIDLAEAAPRAVGAAPVPRIRDWFLSIDRSESTADRSESTAGRGRAVYGLASLVLLGILAHTGFSAQRNLSLTVKELEPGYLEDRFYNTAYWQHSAPLSYVKTHLRDGRTYSNNSFLVWFADQTVAIKKHRMLPYSIRDWTRQMRRWIKRGRDEVHIVWIKNNFRSVYFDYTDLDIRLLPGVETVAESSDSVVFRVMVAATQPFDEDRHRARKQRYQERYVEQLLEQAGERVVRADWDVYRNGHKLTYFKQPCAPADVQAKFVLHVIPADPGVLPIARRRYGFDSLGFYFDRRGVRVGDQCIVTAHLPAYPIGRIRVGQWISDGNRTLWAAEFSGAGA